MKKSFEYIIKISETEFYDKLKKHTAFNCRSSSMDMNFTVITLIILLI